MIYHLFDSKFGLYKAVIISAVEVISDDLEMVKGSTAPVRERFEQFIRLFYRFMEERPELPAIILREHLAGSTRLHGELFPYFTRMFDTTKTLVDEGIRNGELRKVDAHAVHLSLVGSLVFFFVSAQFRLDADNRQLLEERPPDHEAYIRHIQELFDRGLAEA